MAINQLKAGALLSYISIGINNAVGLLFTPFMLRMLGKSEFGLYALVASVVAYLTVLDLGLGNAVIRYTAKYRAQGKEEEQYALFGMFLILYCGVSLLVIISGTVLYHNIEYIFGNSLSAVEQAKARVMVILLILNLALTFPLSIFGSIITAYEQYVFQKLINILRILISPCLMIPLLLMGYKAIGVVMIITVLNIVTLLVNAWYCFFRLKIKIHFQYLEWGLLREISSYSFFIFLGVIVDKIYWSTGQFVLGVVAGTAVVAVYAIAVQLQMYYMTLSTAISGVFLPKVTAMVARNSTDKELSNLFIRTGRIQYVIMAFVLSGFILFGKSFIILWAGPEYEGAYLISLLLMIPLTIPLIQTLGISILQARNQHKFRSLLYIVIATASLAISIPLAKVYGGIGCAIGTAASLTAGNIIAMNLYYYKRINLDIPRFWKEITRMSVPIVVATVFALALNYLYPHNTLLSLFIKGLIFGFLYINMIWWKGLNSFERNLFSIPTKKVLAKFRFYYTH
ncbi:oligosaccharide flippase family protein [Pontibacter sp. BT310]|uniref:Oligosaccharide flippase family protein n=1 Tax=Pontibacter populi TaxID=890055 RepID=A0ABS6XAS0_9BACT|nr:MULTISPECIES: oligosaccharide flippase family protein [Pontibacter]MBJ6118247.1 oligosaccharide flippase family protein [Pontibacter sp. BT310]MBR0570674.1 oligosaccharide flippase family protein [Microvirga sp. STS03]MBW3365100.1 oligosaccharide flippase family protein [Pontibacter populi]